MLMFVLHYVVVVVVVDRCSYFIYLLHLLIVIDLQKFHYVNDFILTVISQIEFCLKMFLFSNFRF